MSVDALDAAAPDASPPFLAGLIGAGVGPSLSPALHEREAARLGRRMIYRTIDVAALGIAPDAVGELVVAARRLGFDGLNITHPCKQLVLAHLDDLSPEAATLGAVNTVTFHQGRSMGHNTDWSGFAQAMARGLPGAATQRVVLLGAGGAGAAVGYGMLTLDVAELVVCDIEAERADALALRLNRAFGDGRCRPVRRRDLPAALSAADGLVHATSVGMAGHTGLPLPADHVRGELWVADIVYRPLRTPLLRLAEERGCRTLPGGAMAVFQAGDAFRLFTGLTPDTGRMLRHLEELARAE